ncbi:hypothetical protein HDU76_011803, partial [Blyttiomyces sp. JEL0837]
VTVPPLPVHPAPDHTATYFLWPGLQPGYADATDNLLPIGNGVLQPVLTYGPACTPNQPPKSDPYRGWWISAQYVNTNGRTPGYTGCLGGPVMDVQPGDVLSLNLFLQPGSTTWTQTATVSSTGKSVSYNIDMKGQSQGRAEIVMEMVNDASLYFDVTFTDIELIVQIPNDPGFCFNPKSTWSHEKKPGETCNGASLSADGKVCTIQSCVFSATGSIPSATIATTLPPPLPPVTSNAVS